MVAISTLAVLLERANASESTLHRLQASSLTLARLVSKLHDRPALLALLKEAGVETLGERQRVVNELAKAERTMHSRLGTTDADASDNTSRHDLTFPAARAPSEHLANAVLLKEQGNASFKAGENVIAIEKYRDAIDEAREANAKCTSPSERIDATALIVSLHANTAAANLRLEHWADVVESASQALELDGEHAKALHRRGVAQRQLGNRSEARVDLVAALRIDPQNRPARDVLAAMDAEQKAEKATVKRNFRERFAKQIEVEDKSDEDEETIVQAWKDECDRLRTQLGRCVVEVCIITLIAAIPRLAPLSPCHFT